MKEVADECVILFLLLDLLFPLCSTQGWYPSQLWIAVTVTITFIFAAIVYKLRQIRDSLGMANEMVRTICVFVLVNSAMSAVHMQMQRGAAPLDTYVSWPSMLMAFYFILETFVVSR